MRTFDDVLYLGQANHIESEMRTILPHIQIMPEKPQTICQTFVEINSYGHFLQRSQSLQTTEQYYAISSNITV